MVSAFGQSTTSHPVIDFNALNARLLLRAYDICKTYLPDGNKQGNEWIAKNPTRTDQRLGSFKVNLVSGLWKDFATDDAGGDLISLVAYVNRSSQTDAARELEQWFFGSFNEPVNSPHRASNPGNEKWKPIVPVPDNAPKPPAKHYKHGEWSQSWTYRNAEGRTVALVCRFDLPGGKEILPLTFCRNVETGVSSWRWKGVPEPRPLYNLDKLASSPEKLVLIGEGEKSCDAMDKMLRNVIATTSMHGSQSPNKTDWTPLAGRDILIWPDADKVGINYANSVIDLLRQVGAGRIRLLDIGKFAQGDKKLPKGWDAADALSHGWTETHLAEIMKSDPEFLREVESQPPNTVEDSSQQAPASSDEVPDWSSPESFGELVPFVEVATPEIEADILPGWLANYADAVARATQTPPAMSVMMTLSILATCLQRKVEVSPYGDDYREPVNIWTVTALPPASRKTAVVQAFTRPLVDWEKAQYEKVKPVLAEQKAKRAVVEKRIAKLKEEAAKTENDSARERLIREIATLECEQETETHAPRLWTSDCTPERLENLLVEQGEKMSLLSDEGGIFEVMSGIYSNGRANIDVFLQGHAGQSVRVDRGGRSAHLNKPALTFGLTVQPEVLRDLSQGSKRKFRGLGALARFLYCLPKSNIGYRSVQQRDPIPAEAKATYFCEILKLLELPHSVAPHVLTLGRPALEEWQNFAQFLESKQGPGGEYESIQDWTGKLPGAALRIAGLFHIAMHGLRTASINKETMTAALDLSRLLIAHAQASFDLIGNAGALADAKVAFKLAAELAKQDDSGAWVVRQTDLLTSNHFKNSPVKRLTDALEALRERGMVSGQQRLATRTKPILVWYLNPDAAAIR